MDLISGVQILKICTLYSILYSIFGFINNIKYKYGCTLYLKVVLCTLVMHFKSNDVYAIIEV